MYHVYILENLKGRHYIGITTDPTRRVKEHNGGSTRSTRPFRPWKIIYTETYNTRKEACVREWYLKHPKGYTDKINIIKAYGEVA